MSVDVLTGELFIPCTCCMDCHWGVSCKLLVNEPVRTVTKVTYISGCQRSEALKIIIYNFKKYVIF